MAQAGVFPGSPRGKLFTLPTGNSGNDACICLSGTGNIWGGEFITSTIDHENEPIITHRIHGTGIFTYIHHKNQPNVAIYTIHGSYGL